MKEKKVLETRDKSYRAYRIVLNLRIFSHLSAFAFHTHMLRICHNIRQGSFIFIPVLHLHSGCRTLHAVVIVQLHLPGGIISMECPTHHKRRLQTLN